MKAPIYIVIYAATSFLCNINAMEKEFALADIFSLVKQKQTHQPFIETFFGHQLPREKPLREKRFIELQNQIHTEAGVLEVPELAKMSVLHHLWLANAKAELEYLNAAKNECTAKIQSFTTFLQGAKENT
ncbi:MAG: hypothetical protein AB7F19_00510 [Candidatus Babeliales bacterium]